MRAIGPLLQREIEGVFTVIKSRCTSAEIVFVCPEASCGDRSGNRSLSLATAKTNCWRCGIGGNFFAWSKKLGHSFSGEGDATAAPMTLQEIFNVKPEARSILPALTRVAMPEGFTRMEDDPGSVYTKLISKMAVRKNLEPEDFIRAGCGFTRTHPAWEPFAIFPVLEYEVPVYYQGRLYAEEPGERTKKFPSNSEVKHGARYWVYGIDEARISKASRLIVVESILNVLSLRKHIKELGVKDVAPVAVFKHRVSVEQYFKLARLPDVREVCLLFDHDAIHESWQGAAKFVNKFKITVAEMPAGTDNAKLDPNDDVALAWQMYEARKPYDKISGLLAGSKAQEEKRALSTLAAMRFS